MRSKILAALILGIVTSLAAAQDVRPPLEFTTKSLPKAILSANYEGKVGVMGGVPPWTWEVIDGELPPGLNLDPTNGNLVGTPTALGQFRFAVEVTDSDDPPESRTHEFTITVVSALTVEWKNPPTATQDGIKGSLKLGNQTADDIDLTMIVVAVNEVGKAFVLGYQHFLFNKQSTLDDIAFGSSLPRGEYIVHVDSIGEVANKNAIYRARIQTTEPLATQ